MNSVITISSKNQITLPVAIMNFLKLNKGNKLWAIVENNRIVLEKEPTWDDLQGSIKDTPLTKDKSTLQIIELAREIESKRLIKKYGL